MGRLGCDPVAIADLDTQRVLVLGRHASKALGVGEDATERVRGRHLGTGAADDRSKDLLGGARGIGEVVGPEVSDGGHVEVGPEPRAAEPDVEVFTSEVRLDEQVGVVDRHTLGPTDCACVVELHVALDVLGRQGDLAAVAPVDHGQGVVAESTARSSCPRSSPSPARGARRATGCCASW